MFEAFRDWLLGPRKKTIASHELVPLVYNSGVQTASGQFVSSDTAMRVTTVFAAVRLLASAVGRLPLNLYREQGDARVILPNHPIAQLLRWRPNNWQTAFEFQSMMMGHLALRGNAYARIIRIGPRPAALIPMHPNYVTVEQRGDGSLVYRGHGILGETLTLEQRDVLHLRAMSSYGVIGINPIAAARNAIGMQLAVDEYGAKLFANGATPSGVLKTEGVLSEEAGARLRAQFEERYAGSENAGRPLVLEQGLSWQAISLSSEDSQFLETRKFNRTEIAALFNIPPHMLGDLERATFTNIEHQSLDFVRNCLEAWLECWEQAIKRDLLWGLEDNGLVVDFDTTKLTQGDFQSLMTSFQMAINSGVMSPNEARRQLGFNPREGGDDYRMTPNSLPEGALPDAA